MWQKLKSIPRNILHRLRMKLALIVTRSCVSRQRSVKFSKCVWHFLEVNQAFKPNSSFIFIVWLSDNKFRRTNTDIINLYICVTIDLFGFNSFFSRIDKTSISKNNTYQRNKTQKASKSRNWKFLFELKLRCQQFLSAANVKNQYHEWMSSHGV